jgi:tRNA(Ile)-lysidine synthase TilS/MesJ
MYFINGNYGNPTLALLQWVYEQTLSEVTVMSVDTGWAAARWHLWTQTVQDYARRCGFAVSVVKPRLDFANISMVCQHGERPAIIRLFRQTRSALRSDYLNGKTSE